MSTGFLIYFLTGAGMNSEGSAGAISEEDDISGWNVENGAFSAQQMEIDDNLGRNGNKDRISAFIAKPN